VKRDPDAAMEPKDAMSRKLTLGSAPLRVPCPVPREPARTRRREAGSSGSGSKLVLSLDSDHHPLPETTYRGDPVVLCVLQVGKSRYLPNYLHSPTLASEIDPVRSL
jgi:hypothetical protein